VKITDILALLGGLALFLYGMQMMSSGLEAAAGNRMKKILEKLTSNRLLPVTDWVAAITPGRVEAQIANMHTIFNITTTVLLLPFGVQIAGLAKRILPDPKSANGDKPLSLMELADDINRGRGMLGNSAIHMDVLRQEITRIVTLAKENVDRCFQAVLDADLSAGDAVIETEASINFLNDDITQYVSRILVNNTSGQDVADIEDYFLITGNAERIGDHALNINEYVQTLKDKAIVFSEEARQEIRWMQEITNRALEGIINPSGEVTQWLSDIAAMEQQIDDMTDTYRERHLERMRQGICSAEGCILYGELLTDFERIGDHVLNIAQAHAKISARA